MLVRVLASGSKMSVCLTHVSCVSFFLELRSSVPVGTAHRHALLPTYSGSNSGLSTQKLPTYPEEGGGGKLRPPRAERDHSTAERAGRDLRASRQRHILKLVSAHERHAARAVALRGPYIRGPLPPPPSVTLAFSILATYLPTYS